MIFSSIPVPDERARAFAAAVRMLDMRYRELRADVADHAGVSLAELDALSAIADHTVVTPKTMASIIKLTTSATTALLDRLAGAGLLHREPHPTDRRSLVIALTPLGERLMTDLYLAYVARFEDLLASCPSSDDDLATLLGSLGRIGEALAVRPPRTGAVSVPA